MTTVRRYINLARADLDKSVLDAAGIPAFLADENSVAIGYGIFVGGVRLQVQDEDVERARRVLQEQAGAPSLPDDFIPPEAPAPEEPKVEIAESSDTKRAVLGVVATLVVVFLMVGAFSMWKASHNAYFYYKRGYARGVKGNLDGAIADYDRAIELRPRYSNAYNNRGYAKLIKGNLDGALADYDKAIELDPDHVRAYYNRGFVKRMNGDLDGAFADYDKAIQLDPKNENAYYGRGVIHYDKRDWGNALVDFRTASTLKPIVSKSETLEDYPHIQIWMARAKRGERDAATTELKQYLLTRIIGKPGDWTSTIIRFMTGDLPESEFLKAADNGDEKQAWNQRCEAYFYVGTVRLIDGDKSGAADYFKRCLETGVKNYYEYQSAAVELAHLSE